MKVSVIVPAYNVEEYINQCLFTLVYQTLEDIEIIVIDDGSTDSTLDLIKAYQSAFPDKIIYRSVPNGGAASARNIALDLARGDYVAFVDSDDTVNLRMLEKLYETALATDSDIVTCGYHKISYKSSIVKDIKHHDCFGFSLAERPDLLTRNVPFLWNKLFRRSLLERIHARFEPFTIYEDLLFTFTAMLHANRVERVSEALYNYTNIRAGSLTFYFNEKRFQLFPVFDLLLQRYREGAPDKDYKDPLLFIYMTHFFVVCASDIRIKDYGLKKDFIKRGFVYMDNNFPGWRGKNLYFSMYKKKKALFTSKAYWLTYNLLPTSVRSAKHRMITYAKTLKNHMANPSWRAFYKAYTTKPVNKKLILLNPQQGANPNGNMFYLLRAMVRDPRLEDYTLAYVHARHKKPIFENLLKEYDLLAPNIRLLEMNTVEFADYLARAGFLFSDTSMPTYFIKRKEQTYLNTWHGTPLKTLGRATAEDYYDIANLQKNFLAADYLLYPSEFMKTVMVRDFMLAPLFKNTYLMMGYPRNTAFFDEKEGHRIRQQEGLANKEVLAYMPTWRGNVRAVDNKASRAIISYLTELDQKLTDQQILFVNLHPYMADSIDYDRMAHIRPFPSKYETYGFLNACDTLITDYSSVFFDFALTGRKIILFTYDEEDYFSSRGVYISLDSLPFPKVRTIDELVTAIADPHLPPMEDFIHTYGSYEGSSVCREILDLLLFGKTDGVRLLKEDKAAKDSKENVLIHLRSFQNNDDILPFLRLVKESDLSLRNYYFTYETHKLAGREIFMKQLPKTLSYFGKLNPYSATTSSQYSLARAIKEGRASYQAKRDTLKRMYIMEEKRAYNDCTFSCHLVFGQEDLLEMGYVAEGQGIKILCLNRREDLSLSIPASIFESFDKIWLPTKDMADRLKAHAPKALIEIGSPSSLDQLLDIGDSSPLS